MEGKNCTSLYGDAQQLEKGAALEIAFTQQLTSVVHKLRSGKLLKRVPIDFGTTKKLKKVVLLKS